MTENNQKPRPIEMYFSVDIETDGEAPGTSSMLSIGAVALNPITLAPMGEFYSTLKRLPGARPGNKTMEWWDGFPKQWAETRANAIDPKQAMEELHTWVIEMCKLFKKQQNAEVGPVPIFVADPACFDFSFVYYYLHLFLGESVFGFSALDLQTYAMACLNTPFRVAGSSKNHLAEWKTELPHTHNALEDARQQAELFVKIKRWRDAQKMVPIYASIYNTEDSD